MNDMNPCTCAASQGKDFVLATDHYCINFIPSGWKLEYATLEQHDPERMLYLTGECQSCGGQDLQSGTSIPCDLTGDALLEHIYRQMETYRPFEKRFDSGAYTTGLQLRSRWYIGQDDLTLGQKNAQFLKLFHEQDWAAVEDWIYRCRSEEPYTKPHRYRKSTFLQSVVERARANGDLAEIDPIIDCIFPSKAAPLPANEDSYLTDYRFMANARVEQNDRSGTHVILSLVGKIDGNDDRIYEIGLFHTPRDDDEASRMMGKLSGILVYHLNQFVSENIHALTPKGELEAQLRNRTAQHDGGEGAAMDDLLNTYVEDAEKSNGDYE